MNRRRYVWTTEPSIYGHHEDDKDHVCRDRLTGKVVVRYDWGDPANWSSEYGAPSDREYLSRKGLDPDEMLPDREGTG